MSADPQGYRKPLPRISIESKPFWEGARAHRLLLQKCDACGRFWFPPSSHCIHCLSDGYAWTEVKGTARIFSFVTYHRLYHPGWEGELPYVVALIELDEGPRLIASLVGIAPEQVKCDMKVRVMFEDVSPEVTVPKFMPLEAAAD